MQYMGNYASEWTAAKLLRMIRNKPSSYSLANIALSGRTPRTDAGNIAH